MKNDIIFITTIFPASEKYLDDFFVSLQKQTNKKFDILVVNDGVKNFNNYKNKYSDLNIIELISEQSIAKNRENGINKAYELKYKYLIFGDSDDFFASNRVEILYNKLLQHNIVINDLQIFRNDKIEDNLFFNFLKEGVYKIDEILDENFIGFSNIAINAKTIKHNIKFEDNLIAVDWFFAMILLLGNNKFYFTNKTYSIYRQHNENTIGINDKLSLEKIKLGIKAKYTHYDNLLQYSITNNLKPWQNIFLKKIKDYKELYNKSSDENFIIDYQARIKNTNKAFTAWWSEIQTLKQIEEYENTVN